MKTLFLFRHAKSSWDHPGLSDADRPLMEKGIKKTAKIIRYLQEKKITPGLIISSQAVRAYETAKLVAAGLHYPEHTIQIDRKIYDGYYDRILDIIYGISNEIDSVMIFGHNPTLTNLANLFLHPGIDDMPTSAVVGIGFNANQWESIPVSKARLLFFITPKNLK